MTQTSYHQCDVVYTLYHHHMVCRNFVAASKTFIRNCGFVSLTDHSGFEFVHDSHRP